MQTQNQEVQCTGCSIKKRKKCRMSLVGWSRNLGNPKSLLEEKYKELELLMAINNPDNLVLIH